jgi:hypothetical protein
MEAAGISVPAATGLLEGCDLRGRGLTGDGRNTKVGLALIGLPGLTRDLGVCWEVSLLGLEF